MITEEERKYIETIIFRTRVELKTNNSREYAQRYAGVLKMLIDTNLDDIDFCRYMERLKGIRIKYKEKIE